MEDEKEEKCVEEKITEMVDNKIKEFVDTGISANNLDALYKLVDIKKDYENIEYWKKKKEEIENEIRKL